MSDFHPVQCEGKQLYVTASQEKNLEARERQQSPGLSLEKSHQDSLPARGHHCANEKKLAV